MNYFRSKLGAVSLLLIASAILSGCSKSSDDSATPAAPGATTAAKSPKAEGGAPSLGNPVPPGGSAKK